MSHNPSEQKLFDISNAEESAYKINRKKKLADATFNEIREIQQLLSDDVETAIETIEKLIVLYKSLAR